MKLLLCSVICLCAQAQISFDVTPNPTGRSKVTIVNHAPSALTAYLAIWTLTDQRPGHFVSTIRDSFLQTTFSPVPTGGSTILQVGDPNVDPHFRIVAALFADGSTYGDPDWARMLVGRRALYVQATENVLKELQTALGQNTPQPELAQQLYESQESQIRQLAVYLPVPGADPQQIYNEPTQAMKDANIRVQTGINRRVAVNSVYTPIVGGVRRAPTIPGVSLRQVLQDLIDRLNQQKAGLLNSKPAPAQ
jgi:hypothetical protein